MSSHKSGSATASESVAKRPHISVTLTEMMEVIRRMEGGQSHNTVCRI
jgi:hypothetical protein